MEVMRVTRVTMGVDAAAIFRVTTREYRWIGGSLGSSRRRCSCQSSRVSLISQFQSSYLSRYCIRPPHTTSLGMNAMHVNLLYTSSNRPLLPPPFHVAPPQPHRAILKTAVSRPLDRTTAANPMQEENTRATSYVRG
jgi:hypothetical protein